MTFNLIQRHKQECRTPKDVFDSLNKEFNFDYDPCPILESPGVLHKIDGLGGGWGKVVFVNPPYNDIPNWLEVARKELIRFSDIIVFLLPVDTSTRWFHDYILGKAEIRFIKGRLKFTDNKNAPFASMVVIFRRAKA